MSTQARTSPDEKLSVTQVANEIGCHPNTVWNHIKTGQLAAVRFGPRLVRVKRSDLEKFISAYRCADKPNWLSVSNGR
jgi:excisionase family DNA binding protein